MKQILLLSTLLLTFISYGQKQIDFKYNRDFDKILAQSKIDTSDIYFDNLFPRFLRGDTTLTNYEMIALQIGYTDNDNYWPYQDISIESEIWALNEKGDYKSALLKCDTILESNPFNLIGNREKSYALRKLEKQDSSQIYINKFDLVALSNLSTGDGKSYETSWFVLSPADGQWIIKLAFQSGICFMGSGSDENGNFHDILGIKFEDSEECTHLYFNIEHASKRMFGPEGMKMFEEIEKEDTKKKKRKKKRNKE